MEKPVKTGRKTAIIREMNDADLKKGRYPATMSQDNGKSRGSSREEPERDVLMSDHSASWRILPEDTAVTMAAKPRRAVFESAGQGMLAVRCVNDLPEGKLLLIATSESRTVHWYQEAVRDGKRLLVSMEGFEEAVCSCPDSSWTLELGKQGREKITSWELRQEKLKDYYKASEKYFMDDTAHYAAPVCSFEHEGKLWEAVPNTANNLGQLSLNVAPVEDRYERQLTCRFRSVEVEKGLLRVRVEMPEGAALPEGLALRPVDGETPCFLSVETKEGAAEGVVDLRQLSAQPGRWELCAVAGREGETLLLMKPRLLSGEIAARLSENYGPRPVWKGEEEKVFLTLTQDFRLELQSGQELPGAQASDCTGLADFLTHAKADGTCDCEHLGGENWQWRLRLPGRDLSECDEVMLVMHRWASHKNFLCPTVVESAGEGGSVIRSDLSCLINTLESCLRDDFYAYIAVRKGNRFWYLMLKDPRHTFYGEHRYRTYFNRNENFYGEPVGATPYAGHSVEATPWWETTGQVGIMLVDECLRYYSAFTCRCEEAHLRFGRLTMRIRCPKNIGGKWVGLMINHRYKLEEDRKEYFIPLTGLEHQKKYDLLTVKTPLKGLEYAPVYWDLRAVFEKDGKRFWISVKAPMRKARSTKQKIKDTVRTLFFADMMNVDKNNQLFLYRTGGNRFALVYQEKTKYSGFWFRLKERLACLIYFLNRKKLRRENIMLTYEKYCCMAQDNGFYFFQYCMENNVEEQLKHKIYYVITPDSADYGNVKPYEDHIIPFMSLKHMVYLLACRLMVSSDSKPHAYAWRCKESIIQPIVERERRLVFLQHGVIALKKVEFFDAATNAVDLFVTSNRREHGIIVRELGYRPEDVIITGLTRWDVLKDRSAEVKGNHILVMPTWRNWLEDVSDEAFKSSDYYRNYMELLNSQRLADYLERHDAYLDFYIHPKFRDYLGNFSISGERVRLIPFGSEPLNFLIMQCKMLVTDYSSVCWDVFYQGKPCIFYQFDVDKYNEAQGAYIDLEKEMFGDRAVNNDQLFRLLEEEADMGFALKPEYAEMRLHSYEYLDHNNSQRVCEEIRRRNW